MCIAKASQSDWHLESSLTLKCRAEQRHLRSSSAIASIHARHVLLQTHGPHGAFCIRPPAASSPPPLPARHAPYRAAPPAQPALLLRRVAPWQWPPRLRRCPPALQRARRIAHRAPPATPATQVSHQRMSTMHSRPAGVDC